jgi:hypothetical protein
LVQCFSEKAIGQDAASGAQIKGKVLEESKDPAAYASVGLLKSSDSTLIKGTMTNDKGEFVLQNIPAGNYLLSFESTGNLKLYTGPYKIDQTTTKLLVNDIQSTSNRRHFC